MANIDETTDAAAGTSLQELRVAGGKGCSLDTDPVRGLAWLGLGGLLFFAGLWVFFASGKTDQRWARAAMCQWKPG